MNRLKVIARDLVKPDNILAVVTIVIATTLVLRSVFGESIRPQAAAEITIALLGLVALTSMIERVSRFAQTDTKVDGIEASVAEIRKLLHDKQGTILFNNDELPHLDTLLGGASEVFVAGAYSFNLLLRYPDRWNGWLRNRKSIKVIVQNPWNKGLRHLQIPSHSYNYEIYKADTEHVIEKLKALRAVAPGMEIRLSNACPTQGVVIVDGQNGGKCMIVALYIPGCGSADRPTMILHRERDPALFDLFYEKYYKYLWNESKPLTSVQGES